MPNVTTELVTMDDGTYQFAADEIQINNPFHCEAGHDSCSPDYYGFTVWETGGGCTAWRRDFTLHGVPVYMLLTAADDAHHHVEDGEDFGVGVYVNGDSDAFVNWTMRNREVDGYSELMAESISRQGTMPTGDDADDTPPECPQCSGPGILLGTLGSTTHYRCRNCGWGFTS